MGGTEGGAEPSGRTGGPDSSALDLSFLEQAQQHRAAESRRRARAALAVPAVVTVGWLVYVLVAGQLDRVADRWVAALTMVFGSFVAGSTPQGGGAVAFPVFTKVLEMPSEVARTFSLCIQTVGMGAAALAIAIRRVAIETRVVALAAITSIAGFLVGLLVLGLPGEMFWPSRVPGPYVKVTFTVITVAMAVIVLLGMRVRVRAVRTAAPVDPRARGAVLVAGFIGGVAASLVGSGADLAVYLVLAILLGVDPRVGIPTSVVTMAVVSVVGFVVLGLVDGQLAISLDAANQVTGVGGQQLPASVSGDQFDLFGMWLAAIPVVAWVAPLGAWAAARMRPRTLVLFAGSLAAAELLTTILFLPELRTDPWLVAYGLGGLVLTLMGLRYLAARRIRLFGVAGVDPTRTLTRVDLDVDPGYREALQGGRGDARRRRRPMVGGRRRDEASDEPTARSDS